mgnify:CR=1 FL=1
MSNILSQENKIQIVEHLNKILSDEYVLFTKLFKYHWNVTGPFFGPLHTLFENQYQALFVIIDEVAERSRALNHVAFGTLKEFCQHTRLQEQPGHNPSSEKMITDLVTDHETIINHLRSDIIIVEKLGDQGTMDFLTELMQKHEKMAWLLRAHLQ